MTDESNRSAWNRLETTENVRSSWSLKIFQKKHGEDFLMNFMWSLREREKSIWIPKPSAQATSGAELPLAQRCGKSRLSEKLRVSFEFIMVERSMRLPCGDVEV